MRYELLKSVTFIFLLLLQVPGLPEQQKPVVVKEFVRVVNIEVIARIVNKGQLVSGLKKSDFRLTENGHEVEIHGFSEFHRTLAPKSDLAARRTAPSMDQEKPAPRLLILYFWLLEPGIEYQQALDYFFKTVYRANDRVLLVSSMRVYEISRPEEIAAQRSALTADIDDFTRQVANFRRQALANRQIGASRNARDSFKITSLRDSLAPVDINVEQFRKFAASLKKIEMEKWVLVFCQRNLAMINSLGFISSEVSAPTRFVQKYAVESDLLGGANSFSSLIFKLASAHKPLVKFRKAEMKKMFIQCGATFHLLVLGSDQRKTLHSEQGNYIELQTGWQDVFAAISSATGGMVLQEMAMAGALQKFSQQEDVYYVLTYEPVDQPRLKRKVKLEMPEKGYEIFYNNEGVQRQADRLAINGLEWQEPLLKLKIENYLLDLLPQGIVGHVTLTIRVVPEKGEELASVRELFLPEKKPEIELKLRFPKKGRYHLFIEAVDRLGLNTAWAETEVSWRGVALPATQPRKTATEILGNENGR